MIDTMYHVYDKNNKVVAHTLSEVSLTEKILRKEIDFETYDVVECTYDNSDDCSY